MQPETAHQYRQRWRTLADLERAEQQAASVAQRWKQLAVILRFGRCLPLVADASQHNEADTWRRLREKYEHIRRA